MTRILVLFLGIVLSFIACRKPIIPDYKERSSYFKNIGTYSTSDSILTCVTFNIHLGFRANQDPWDKSQLGCRIAHIDSIAQVLGELDPDIIALQEVPKNRYNAEVKDFLEALAERMEMNWAWGAHGYNDPTGIYPVYGEWGNAILSKFPIEAIHNEQVDYVNQWEKRSLMDATLRLNDTLLLSAISLHHLPNAMSVPNTISYLKSNNQDFILMGDFNRTGNIEEFTEINLSDVDSMHILHAIDRIFIDKSSFNLVEIGQVTKWQGLSDHPINYSRIVKR